MMEGMMREVQRILFLFSSNCFIDNLFIFANKTIFEKELNTISQLKIVISNFKYDQIFLN